MDNSVVAMRIKNLFKEKYPELEILRVIDYREKNIYVIRAVPKKHFEDRNKWLDGTYSVDMKTFKIGGFQPMSNDPKTFFSIPKNRVIFQRS